MSEPKYPTSITFTQEDFDKKEELREYGVSIIEAWRIGAEVKLKEMRKKNG